MRRRQSIRSQHEFNGIINGTKFFSLNIAMWNVTKRKVINFVRKRARTCYHWKYHKYQRKWFGKSKHTERERKVLVIENDKSNCFMRVFVGHILVVVENEIKILPSMKHLQTCILIERVIISRRNYVSNISVDTHCNSELVTKLEIVYIC